MLTLDFILIPLFYGYSNISTLSCEATLYRKVNVQDSKSRIQNLAKLTKIFFMIVSDADYEFATIFMPFQEFI